MWVPYKKDISWEHFENSDMSVMSVKPNIIANTDTLVRQNRRSIAAVL